MSVGDIVWWFEYDETKKKYQANGPGMVKEVDGVQVSVIHDLKLEDLVTTECFETAEECVKFVEDLNERMYSELVKLASKIDKKDNTNDDYEHKMLSEMSWRLDCLANDFC